MTPGLRDVFAFSWRHWRRRPITLAILGVGIGGKVLAEITGPIFIGKLIDALSATDYQAAVWALGMILAMRLLFVVLHSGGDYAWTYLAVRILREICADAFSRVQKYSAEWHANTFAGSTVRKITRGFWAFDHLGDSFYFHLIPSAAVVLGVLVAMTFRWPEMAALFGLGCALYCWVSIHLTMAYFAPKRREAVEYDTKLGGALADSITCNALVKATGAEEREDQRLGGVLESWYRTHIRCWRAAIDTSVAQMATMLVVQAVLLGLSLWLWKEGRASTGDVAYVLTSFMLVNGYLRDVGQHIREAQHAVNDLEDIVEYDLTDPDVLDRFEADCLDVRKGEILFDGVGFCYPRSGDPVFDGLDLTIEPGEKVALVGHSGSGKSTFVKLLQRLYDIDEGRILIDGQDIAGVTQRSLREQIALVPQEPILFHRSLAENIAYGRPDADLQGDPIGGAYGGGGWVHPGSARGLRHARR